LRHCVERKREFSPVNRIAAPADLRKSRRGGFEPSPAPGVYIWIGERDRQRAGQPDCGAWRDRAGGMTGGLLPAPGSATKPCRRRRPAFRPASGALHPEYPT